MPHTKKNSAFRSFVFTFLVLPSVFLMPAFGSLGEPVAHPGQTAKPSDPLIQKVAAGEAFSFIYGGQRSQDLLPRWKKTARTKSLDDGRELQVTTYRDEATGIEIAKEVTLFPDAPAVECILRLRNTGTQDTPIIEKLLPLDLEFTAGGAGKIVLHYARGSMGSAQDYLPIDQQVSRGAEFSLAHYVLQGANHVDGQLPFFNLQGPGGGLIGAVGWTGQWAVRVRGESEGRVVVQAGQQTTHLKLHPGESIRTPRILLLQWTGNDRFLGHNQFRKLLFAHYVPRIDGQVVVPPVGNSNAFVYQYEAIAKETGQNPLTVVSQLKPGEEKSLAGLSDDALNWVNEKNQLDFIRGIPPVGMEVYWLDAGWFEGEWPFGVGSWIPDPKKFPHGLRPMSDAAHEKGLKFLLWFEPGRVGPGSQIATEHPNFVLHRPEEGKLGGLFNYGNPAALRWMTENLSGKISDWGIDIYRQDSNMCPLLFWKNTDDPDRQGITEIRWVEGLYALWDGLLQAHPKLIIDNANWRITGPDIEVMSRSVGSLTRSETECGGIPHPTATQVQTAELSLWTPMAMGAVNGFDSYTFRSAATSGVGSGLDLRASYVPLEQFKHGVDELKSLRRFWEGDYYPLTDITPDERAWAGWQFDRPDLKSGFALFFRRSLSQQRTLETGLRGLDPAVSYDVTFAKDYESVERRKMTGEQLTHMRVEIDANPGSMLITYAPADVSH
jgi:alpha-galactosidase